MDLTLKYWIEAASWILVGATLATPILLLNIRIAPRLGLIDWPKARGLAEDQIPIIGYSLVLISLAFFAFGASRFNLSPWFVTTAVIIAIVGHLDDRKPLSAFDKMFFQILCVSIVVGLDPTIHSNLVTKYGAWGGFWGGFFILGLMNAINFIDGIDGLAALVLVFGSAGFFLFSSHSVNSFFLSSYSLLLMGMLIPFLYLNVMKRRGFLGNVGSYFLSYVVAMMHVSVDLPAHSAISRLSLSALCFLVPIADATTVILSRLFTRRSPFQADKGHLHHRLIQTSLPLRYILLNFGIIEAGGLVAAVLLTDTSGASFSILPIGILLSHVGLVSALVVLVEKASKRRSQSFFRHLDASQPIYYFKYRVRKEDGSVAPSYVMNRLEARINAEIRVNDLCYLELPDVLVVTLQTGAEPLKRISNRLDVVFRKEKVKTDVTVEQGEFGRMAQSEVYPLGRSLYIVSPQDLADSSQVT